MTGSSRDEIDLAAAVKAEFLALSDLLEKADEDTWSAPSLCEGWRVREVVAHMTMPARYTAEQFGIEMSKREGDFTRLSNELAAQDADLPVATLIDCLRDPAMHAWEPPGGGLDGALSHAVIHGLDITNPLGLERCASDQTIGYLLKGLTSGGGYNHFGVELDAVQLRATDIDWEFGSGSSLLAAPAGDLVSLICGRELSSGPVAGERLNKS